ncbi:cytoskeleton-associated protein 2-like [Tympanuchus pallidicinctus]|uniref:cytoskeleton-associated protein 2-like n=1 Tax=Tympanuchus pallidicinctus TaxID=109042 RepID=UPI002286E686|nr:cytoskeleton-associated protein 2-like [Tympanuchus pallidicinctus]
MAAAAQEERRRKLQEYLEAKRKLKCPSTKPYLKDRTNRLDPLLKPVSKPEHLDRNKKGAVQNVAKGTWKDDKPAAKPAQPAGHAALRQSSRASQRAAAMRPRQLGKGTELPAGLVPSTNPSAQPKGRLPASASCLLNPGRPEESGSGQPVPGAPCSLSEGLQEWLGCGKENLPAQAAANPVPSNTFQSNGNSLGKKRALAHGQSSGTVSRTVKGPKDRINSCQAKEVLIQEKFRKPLPASKSASQKPSGTTRPLQPPQFLANSTRLLHKKPAVKQEKNNAARELGGKLGTSLMGTLKHSNRAPAKPPASSRPQGTTSGTTRTPGLKLCTTGQWQRPTVKGGADRKDVKAAPCGHAAVSRAGVPKKQSLPSTYSSRTQGNRGEFGSSREVRKPELLQAHGVHAGRVPKSPTPEDRRRQLEQWLASKGKCYKRPPMTLPPKKPMKQKPAHRSTVQEEQKPEKPEQLYLARINALLTECLKLIEEGIPSEELSTILCHEPSAEKCAKFWICKAKLLARDGPFDVTGLYEAAVCAGAEPLQELREVVLDILKTAEQPSEGQKPEQRLLWEPTTPCPGERQQAAVTPCQTERALSSLPVSSIKLQVTSVPRVRELPEGQELKFLTPVRRSLRIERAGSHYPEMLRDHDPVVSSLSEILDDDEETQFFFRKNKALPEVAEMEVLSL